MRIMVALLALSLVGSGDPEPPLGSQIAFQFRLIEVNGLGWRADQHASLHSIRSAGAGSVWTAPKEVVEQLQARARQSIVFPRVTALENSPAHATRKPSVQQASEARSADRPRVVAYRDAEREPGKSREGVTFTAMGRALEQGVLARVVMDDTRVQAVHKVKIAPVGASPCRGDLACCGESEEAAVEIPEITNGEVSGEWLIPKEGALIVSLGVYTVADKDGKAVVLERLGVLEAQEFMNPPSASKGPSAPPRPLPASIGVSSTPALPPATIPPTPKLPSRSLPIALNASGEPVELPPLPALPPPTRMPGTSDPCGTPQMAGSLAPAVAPSLATRFDSSLNRAGFESTATQPKAMEAEQGGSSRRFSLGTPGGMVTIEVRALSPGAGDDKAPPPPFRP